MENLAPPTSQPATVPDPGTAGAVAPAAPVAPVVAAPVIPVAPAVPPKPGMFDGITLVDVGIIALVSLSMFYSIYYHRLAIKKLSTSTNSQNDIDELKANVKSLMGPDYQTMT